MNFIIAGMDFSTLTWVLLIYSFLGWFYESTIFSIIEQGKLMNRGCFIGPYCPIYGVVSVLNLYLLSDISSSLKIVVIASLSCCMVEYVTSYALEKIFHARYWDYSYFPLNINGRISLISGLFFGVLILFLVKVLHPFTLIRLGQMAEKPKYVGAVLLWVMFIVDAVFTTIGMCNLNRKCKELYDAWDNYVESKLDKINGKKEFFNQFLIVEKGRNVIVKLKGINRKFVDLETRYLKVFPTFTSLKYGEVIDKMKEAIYRKKNVGEKNAKADTADAEESVNEDEKNEE